MCSTKDFCKVEVVGDDEIHKAHDKVDVDANSDPRAATQLGHSLFVLLDFILQLTIFDQSIFLVFHVTCLKIEN